MPGDMQITLGMTENNITSANISFTINGRGAISKVLDWSPNSVELILTNSLDECTFAVEVPLKILFTQNGIIGIETTIRVTMLLSSYNIIHRP